MTSMMCSNEEAQAIYNLLSQLSGGNFIGYAFAYDGSDTIKDSTTRAIAKLFLATDREEYIPKNVIDQMNELGKEQPT